MAAVSKAVFLSAGPGSKQKPPQPVKELSVNMSVLGRRRTKTWHEGTLTEIRSIGRTTNHIQSPLQLLAPLL